jgi:large repetitive protein
LIAFYLKYIMKNKLYNFFLIIALFVSANMFAQPANDDCAGAITLPIGNVPVCGTGTQTSSNTVVSGTITTATPGNPYIYQPGCTGSSTVQSFPANDVWYKYVAKGYKANISVTSTFATPNISVYAGSCAALGGGVGGCAVGTGGTASLLVDQMVVGTTYYIQVSGATGQTGTFNLTINNAIDCNDCLTGSSLTVTPLPVNGAYAPGTTVNFCYHVSQYNHVNTNWLHGVQLSFGSGWNAASLVAAVPTSTSTGGAWSYYTTGIGVVNGTNWGPGWYWETVAGQNNPKNNFGDPAVTANAGMWNFCVSLTTPVACTPGADLSVDFNTSGDGESGSWSSSACSTDGATSFNAIGACCPPTMSSLPLNCNGVPTGSATATPVGTQNPYTYNWSGPSSYSSTTTGVSGANTITGLAAGVYTVQIIDKNLCGVTSTVNVTQPTALVATVTPVNASCLGAGSITTAASGGTPAYTYTWTGPGAFASNAQSPTGLTVAGVYTLTMSDSKGCTITKTVSIMSTGTVTSTFTGPGTQCLVGNSFTFNNTGTAVAAHQYSFSPAAGAPAVSTQTNYVGATFTAPGTYTVTHTVTSGVCVNTTTAVVTINPNPLATLTATNPTCGNNNGIVLINNTSCCAQTISSFASSLGAIAGQTVTGLGAGTPVITLTNSFGCTFTVSTTLTMTPGPTNITLVPTNATCGNNNGSFTFGTPVGGTPTYSYAINGGAFSATSPTTGLAPATYSVTIQDANGCVFTKTTSIINVPGPTAIAGTPAPASCAGPTGSYTVTGVTGGTAAYTYSVDGGAFSASTTYAGLASGTHTVTVKDLNGCLFTTTFNVGVIAGITSGSVSSSPASCGTANGTSTITGITGGVPTYSYSYDGGAFTTVGNTTGLTAGNHTVVVMDVNTCTLSVPYTVASLGAPTTSITSFSNVTCFGLSNGSCTVAIPTGGAGAPFTYSLTTPLQTNGTGLFSGLAPGSYNISVKDAAGCIATTTVLITQPTQVVITPSSLPVLCNGGATGTVNVVGSDGTPGYTYNLNGGAYQASTSFPNQSAGTYLMGVKDLNGCTATQTVVVTQPAALAITVSTQSANCTAANGVGSSTVTGGLGFITYSWTPTGGAAAVSNSVVAGNYTVTATDANGCVISSPAVIGIIPGGTAGITASTNVTCNGLCDGSLTAGMTGGAGPFTYLWSPGGQTNATATNLCLGTYSCVIADFFGCVSTAVGAITQPTPLVAVMNSNNVKCFGTATGTVSAAGTGGAGGYTYFWPTLASTLSTVPNVALGNYSCTITDANGCSIISSIGVTEPSSITLTSTVTAANCGQANGSATITAFGGVGAYTYTWSTTGSNTVVQSSVVANTYTVQVNDANNCAQILAVTIPNVAGPSISVTSQTNVTCFGLCNGVATTSVSGGVTPYIYSWSNGQVTSSGTNLCAGLYTVSATDNAGCVTSTSVNIVEPTALTVTISPTDPKCFGATNGFGVAAAFGGTPTYTYSWGANGNTATSNQIGAGNYGLTVTDGNGCVVTSSMALFNPPAMAASITSTNVTCFNACNGIAVASSTNGIGAVNYLWTGGASPVSSQTLTGACTGTFTVLAADQNSCTASAQVIITQPTQVTANISSTGSVTCFGGNNGFAVVTPGGGTGAYSYSWAPSGGTAATASTLTAGNYMATVTDANGCSATAVANILQPAAFTTTLTTTNVKCNGAFDGTGNVAFTGGVGVPTFSWMPGLQSGNSVNSLGAGTQTVIITSNGSCVNTITFTLTEPAILTSITTATNSNCGQANGKMCSVVGGGTAPYNYLWCNGVTTLCNNNVLAGACTFTVTDANGCNAISSGLVNDIAGPVVSITSQTNVSCFNGTNGAATTTITGGVGVYDILWTPSLLTTSNVATFNAGLHNITVTDGAGCIGTASVQITQPTQLVSAIGSFTNVTCNGFTNGAASILVNGGTTNYSYLWTPSAITSSLMVGVGANTYTCNVTDANGCTTSKQVVISQPQPLIIAASSFTNVSCFGGTNGQISTTIQGGTPIYSYTWTPAQNPSGAVISSLVAGGYSLAVSDGNNCNVSTTFNIIEPSALTSTYTSLPATCGLSNGSATVTIGGGTPSYNVTWNTGPSQTGTIATNMQGGNNWIATITDAKGCTTTQTVSVAAPPLPSITGFSVNPPTCFGLSNATVAVTYTSGTAPYTVAWSNPISQTISTSLLTNSVSGIAAGLYSVILTDNYGCTTSQQVNVIQPNVLVLIPSPNVTICYGQLAQISANGTGGTPGYTYTWTPNTISGSGPVTVTPTVTSSYNVYATDANGCTTSPKVITVAVTPQLVINGFMVTKCEGETATLVPNITSAGNGGPYNFAWSNGVTATSVPTSSISVIAALPTPNQYTVTIDDGCTIMNPMAAAVFTVNVNPVPQPNISANPRLGCSPLTVTLTALPNVPEEQYTWVEFGLTGGSEQVVTLTDSGYYQLTLIATNTVTGCYAQVIEKDYIYVYPAPVASFYADPPKASILDPNIDFINTSQGATNYYWNFGDPAAQNGSNTSTVVNPSHSYGYVGEYKVNLVAISEHGCRDIASLIVEITPEFALYIPNTFTPDGNGLNDVFQPMGVGIDEDDYRLDIFDRWGENIFTSNNFRKGWDGTVKGGSKSAPQGVYTYKMMVKDIMGNKHPKVGHVTVIRQNQ